MECSSAVCFLSLSVCLLSLLLPHITSAIFPHQQRRFLGRENPSLHTYSPRDSVSVPPYRVLHAVQKLDHFNATDTRNFSQRYLVLDYHWDKKGPIFVYTGNEGDIIWFYQNTVCRSKLSVIVYWRDFYGIYEICILLLQWTPSINKRLAPW